MDNDPFDLNELFERRRKEAEAAAGDKLSKTSETTKKYYMDSATLGNLVKALAEARDDGVPADARVTAIYDAPDPSNVLGMQLISLLTSVNPNQRSFICFSW